MTHNIIDRTWVLILVIKYTIFLYPLTISAYQKVLFFTLYDYSRFSLGLDFLLFRDLHEFDLGVVKVGQD